MELYLADYEHINVYYLLQNMLESQINKTQQFVLSLIILRWVQFLADELEHFYPLLYRKK